jgi:hypothetical protein
MHSSAKIPSGMRTKGHTSNAAGAAKSAPLRLASLAQARYAQDDTVDALRSGCVKGRPKMVELSGYRPPSPRSLTGAFSRLSFEFVLIERTPRSVAYRSLQILDLARTSNHASVPARVYDRKAEWFGPTLCVR